MRSRVTRLMVGLAFAVAAVVGVSACGGQPAGTSTSTTASAVSPAAFAELARQQGTVVIDVRTPAEFQAGHLADAINIDVESADFASRVATLNKSTTYALYCRTGHRSATAVAQMRAAGFSHVTDLAGGITAWVAAGRPVVTG